MHLPQKHVSPLINTPLHILIMNGKVSAVGPLHNESPWSLKVVVH